MPTKAPDDSRLSAVAESSFDDMMLDRDEVLEAGAAGVGPVPGPPSCPSCHSATLPVATFCQLCGRRGGHAAGVGGATPIFSAERRLVTILFCDLVNSVGMAAGRDPEDVADAMRQFHGILSATMTRFGGYFERPMGDGGLFYFGYPSAAEDDCERAVEAALETIEIIARQPPLLGTRLQVRIGIAAGVVVIGDLLGAADGGGHDVIGDVANLAARLQQTALPGCVQVSDAVWQLTRTAFDYEDLGPVQLRGWSEAIQLWRPLRRLSKTDRVDARLTGADAAPMVDRVAELATLAKLWEQATNGNGQTVLLIGEPGIGKSRLAQELVAAIVPPDTTVVRYSCSPMQQDTALHPVIERLVRDSGLAAGDPPATRAAKVAALLAGLPEPNAALIGGLVAPDVAQRGMAMREASPERQRDRILTALLEMLLRATADGPLLLLVEDAHWSDPTTRVLLARIAAAAPARPMLLVIAARPQFRPEWADGPDVCRLPLDPLPPSDSERLVRAAWGSARLTDDVVADIVARSDGVPLFLEEVTRSVLEPGGTDRDVPASIRASLLSRIDRLGRARGVAEVAAAIGRVFDLALLRAVCEEPPAELSQSLSQLIASGLVRPDDAGGRGIYMFRHALIRDATYGTIVRRRRRALHLRIAEILERDFPADAAAHPQELALHYAAGGLDQKAAVWWLQAGLQSLQRSAMTEALTQLRRSLALLEPLPDSADREGVMLEVLVVYGKVLGVIDGHAAETTRDAFARAHALCDKLGDPPQLLTVLFTGWTQSFFSGRLARAEVQSSELMQRAHARNDNVWLVMGYYSLGLTRLLRGDMAGSKDLLEHAVQCFEPARRADYARPAIGDPLVISRSFLGWEAMMRGAFSEARQHLAAAIADAYALRQPFSLSLALHTRFYVVLTLHGPEVAAGLLDEYNTAASGIEHFEAFGQIIRGWLLGATGQYEEGLVCSRRGRSRHAASGTQVNHANGLRTESEMLLGLGRPDQALDGLDAAKRLQIETTEHWDDVEYHRTRAEVLVALSRHDAAEAELTTAIALARKRGQHLFTLRASIAQARLLAGRGQHGEAGVLLREGLAAVEPDPTVLDVVAARELLAELAVTS